MMNSSPRKILVIDDEPDLRDTIQEILQAEHFEVLSAANGKEALQVIEKDPWIHLVLCDLSMPVLSGPEFIRLGLTRFPHIPIAVISAHSASETLIEAMRLGAVDYFIKPFDMVAMVEKVYVLVEMGVTRQKALLETEANVKAKERTENLLRLKNAKRA
jgi:DNA-binding NtrC family response regulator